MKYNLILGSGGIKGFCHIGVIKALEELQLPIEKVIGVSSGALIGLLYTNGFDYEQIQKLFLNLDVTEIMLRPYWKIFFDFVRTKRFPFLFDGKKLSYKLISDYGLLHNPNFYIVVSNYTKRQYEIYSGSGVGSLGEKVVDIKDLLAATISIPGIFEPVMIDGDKYCDGGTFVGNCPLDLMDDDNTNIGVQISYAGQERNDIGLIQSIIGAYELTQYYLWKEQIEDSKKEILIVPDCTDYLATDFHISTNQKLGMIDLGYKCTMEALTKIIK